MNKLKSTLQTIALDLIVKVDNFRTIFNETDVSGLFEDIQMSGLETPLMVVKNAEGTYELLRGHRRRNALAMFQQHDPAGFEKSFSKGIPCEVFDKLTPEQKLDLRGDIGNSKGLTNPYEVYLFVSAYLDLGLNEPEAVIKSKEVLDNVYPPTKENRETLEGFARDVEAFRVAGHTQNAIQAEKDMAAHYKKMRHGVMQGITALHSGPMHLLAAMYHEYNGSLPPKGHKHFVGAINVPAKFTQNGASGLIKTYKKEQKEGQAIGVTYTRSAPGPKFLAAYEAWCEADPKKKADSPKALSHTEIGEIKGQFDSPLAQKMLQFCQNQSVEGLAEADRESFLINLVKVHQPEEYRKVLSMGEEIMADRAASMPVEVTVEG